VTTNQGYYLVLVCGAFAVFAVSMAVAYMQYRNWLKQRPAAAERSTTFGSARTSSTAESPRLAAE
jgi:hypothetical protein